MTLPELVFKSLITMARHLDGDQLLEALRILNARLMDLEVFLNDFEARHGRQATDDEIFQRFIMDRFPAPIADQIGGSGGD